MNKRPIIFVIALTLALFGLNEFFNRRTIAMRKQVAIERAQAAETALMAQEGKFQKRVESLPALPLAQLYLDHSLSQPASYAVEQSGVYLLTAWQESIPDTLYVKGEEGAGQRLQLYKQSDGQGSVVLYAREGAPPHFFSAKLPDAGATDLQLVYFTGAPPMPQVALGVVEEGSFIGAVPAIPSTAIALCKTEQGYLPCGVYTASTFEFRRITAIPYFFHIAELLVSNPAVIASNAEEYFVLENDYIQLVFSTVGGAIAEMNLPFASTKDSKSAVRPIEIDRIMEKEYSFNTRFPLVQYHTYDMPHVLKTGKIGGYYPLLRRPILGPRGHVRSPVLPQYYGMNLVGDDPQFAQAVYRVKRFEKNLIEFEAVSSQWKITKTFTLPANPDKAPYCFDVLVHVDGNPGQLRLTSGVPEVEKVSGDYTPYFKYRAFNGNKPTVYAIKTPKDTPYINHTRPEWVSNSNGFFGVIIDPAPSARDGFRIKQIPGVLLPTRLSMIDARYNLYPAEKYPGYEALMTLPTGISSYSFRVFSGPYANSILARVDEAYYTTDHSPDLPSAQSADGWFSFLSEPFAKLLFLLMEFFHYITKSWGFSIILLTVALRVMLYPLNAWSIHSTLKMQQISPHVQALQAKYKKDPKRAQTEIMHLYREKGVNPVSGCFPLLIQLPFLIGMFDLLKSAFELRGSGFIPGWIDDLTAPDVLFRWNYPIFFLGNAFHLLPILLGVVMYIQQKCNAKTPKDPSQMTDQQRQQKFMGNIMVIVFTVMFYHFPAGLNIYWLSSMVLGILQQWYMSRAMHMKSPKVEIVP